MRIQSGCIAQHQDADGGANLTESHIEDIARNQQRHQGVDQPPIEQDHQTARQDNRNRSHRIGQIMQKGCADVHTVLGQGIGQQGGDQIHHQGNSGNDDHHPPDNRLWLKEPHYGLIDQIQADHDQGRIINQCGDDFCATIAKSHILICRSPRDLAGHKGDDQGNRVRKIMQRIGNQGQTARQDTTNDLHHRQGHVHEHSPEHLRIPGFGIDVVMMVMMSGHMGFFAISRLQGSKRNWRPPRRPC